MNVNDRRWLIMAVKDDHDFTIGFFMAKLTDRNDSEIVVEILNQLPQWKHYSFFNRSSQTYIIIIERKINKKKPFQNKVIKRNEIFRIIISLITWQTKTIL